MPDDSLLKIQEILIFDINNRSAHKRISLRVKRNKGDIITRPEYFVASETGEKIKIPFCVTSGPYVVKNQNFCRVKKRFLDNQLWATFGYSISGGKCQSDILKVGI